MSRLKSCIQLLTSQTNCPVCGQAVVNAASGPVTAIATFSCGCELTTVNDQIIVSHHCPQPSMVAVSALNNKVLADLQTGER